MAEKEISFYHRWLDYGDKVTKKRTAYKTIEEYVKATGSTFPEADHYVFNQEGYLLLAPPFMEEFLGNRMNSIGVVPSGLSSTLKNAYIKQGNMEHMFERAARLHPSIQEALIVSGVPLVVKEIYFAHARFKNTNYVDSEFYRYFCDLDVAKRRSFFNLGERKDTHVIYIKDVHGRQVTSHVPGESDNLWHDIVPTIEECERERNNIAYWIQEHITKKAKQELVPPAKVDVNVDSTENVKS